MIKGDLKVSFFLDEPINQKRACDARVIVIRSNQEKIINMRL